MKQRTCICGKKFTPKSGNHRYCDDACRIMAENKSEDVICINCGSIITDDIDVLFCSDECYIEYRDKPTKSEKCQVECTCPLCDKLHKKKLNWTGRGKPRVYCDECKVNL
jgi:hypothetical protein